MKKILLLFLFLGHVTMPINGFPGKHIIQQYGSLISAAVGALGMLCTKYTYTQTQNHPMLTDNEKLVIPFFVSAGFVMTAIIVSCLQSNITETKNKNEINRLKEDCNKKLQKYNKKLFTTTQSFVDILNKIQNQYDDTNNNNNFIWYVQGERSRHSGPFYIDINHEQYSRIAFIINPKITLKKGIAKVDGTQGFVTSNYNGKSYITDKKEHIIFVHDHQDAYKFITHLNEKLNTMFETLKDKADEDENDDEANEDEAKDFNLKDIISNRIFKTFQCKDNYNLEEMITLIIDAIKKDITNENDESGDDSEDNLL